MLLQNDSFENTPNAFYQAVKTLQITKLLHMSNVRKACGKPVGEVFQFLILLAFQGKNLFRFLNSNHAAQAGAQKNTFYRFMSDPSYNWKKFLLLLAAKVINNLHPLTKQSRVKVFILDDSTIARNRSKKVELLARIFDHVSHKFVKGFTLLTLGWSDGYSFIPLAFNLLSSAKDSNRYQEISASIDHRTNGYKARLESMLHKPDAALRLLKNALEAGICADYVLMDTWFTTEPFINSIRDLGLDVIGMVKQLKQRYMFHGKAYTLEQLQKIAPCKSAKECFGSLVVYTKKHHIPVKIVFVRNRNKRSECLYILSTDIELSDAEIIRIYGNRWSIEVFFKASKSLFKLGKEVQSRSYNANICHTTIVFTRYILLEWIRRNENDPKTYGILFFDMCDDIQDMELVDAFKSLMKLFVEIANDFATENTETIKSKLKDWITSQTRFVQALFANLCWES